MKKIAAIASYKYLPSESGGQKYISNFFSNLATTVKLTVIGTENNNVPSGSNYELKKYLKRNPLSYIDFIGLFKTYKLLKREKISTLIIEHPYIGWMGILLKRLLKIKLIIHTHNIEYLRFQTLQKWWWPLLKIYETWILKNADHVFAISEDDIQWMYHHMNIDKVEISLLPYGVFIENAPVDKEEYKQIISKKYSLNESKPLIFFNGALDYKPNEEAVEYIVSNILPKLIEKDFQFNLIIAGKNLDKEIQSKLSYYQNVHYLGFVEDIDSYTKAADIFINPVISGGGVKTKLIEALAMNCTCISTEAGAIGVDKYACGNKLKIVTNKDWSSFVTQIIDSSKLIENIPDVFYKRYNWRNIIEKTSRYI
ncbi:MAG: glycosyltransferase family 4 protein [Bacteroidetes bacterium]|nr:glycosyltransferase family 4 protein [Bacteroidota bacterium]